MNEFFRLIVIAGHIYGNRNNRFTFHQTSLYKFENFFINIIVKFCYKAISPYKKQHFILA